MARPQAWLDAYMRDNAGAVCGGRCDCPRPAFKAPNWSKGRRPTRFEARLAELAARTTAPRAASKRSSLIHISTMRSTAAPTGQSALSRSPARSSTAKPRPGPRAATASPKRSKRACAATSSRPLSCASTAPAGRSWRRNGSARPCSPPRNRNCRWWCRWAASRRRAAIGSAIRRFNLRRSHRPSRIDRVFGIIGRAQGRWTTLASGPTGSRRHPLSAARLFTALRPKRQLIQAGLQSTSYGKFSRCRQSRRKSPADTNARRAAGGTAARRAIGGWSTLAGLTTHAKRAARKMGDKRGVTYSTYRQWQEEPRGSHRRSEGQGSARRLRCAEAEPEQASPRQSARCRLSVGAVDRPLP